MLDAPLNMLGAPLNNCTLVDAPLNMLDAIYVLDAPLNNYMLFDTPLNVTKNKKQPTVKSKPTAQIVCLVRPSTTTRCLMRRSI